MKVTLNILPDSQAELTIEVSPEDAQPFVDAAAERISQEVEIKGFRKGKIPYDILVQTVGEATIYEEAFSAVVEDSYPKAVDQEKLQVIGRAQIDAEKVAPGNPFVYKATVPLMPKIELGEYTTVKAQKAKTVMDEKKYIRTVEDLRKMRAKEKLVDRAAKTGDKVIIDYVVTVDNVPIEGGTAQKQPIVLGEGKMIPGFEEAIEGMKKNEEKDFELKFPKDYKKELADKPANFHITLHDVYELELPELNDEFAKELNFETAAKLEKEIKKNILAELEQKTQEEFEVAVIEEIIKKSKIDTLPPQIVQDEVQKMIREIEQDIAQQGLKFEDYLTHLKKTREDLEKDFTDKAQQRIKAALVMREVAVKEDIKVEKEEIEKEIEELKRMYKDVPDAIQQIESEGQRSQIENSLIHKKTFERLESFSRK